MLFPGKSGDPCRPVYDKAGDLSTGYFRGREPNMATEEGGRGTEERSGKDSSREGAS